MGSAGIQTVFGIAVAGDLTRKKTKHPQAMVGETQRSLVRLRIRREEVEATAIADQGIRTEWILPVRIEGALPFDGALRDQIQPLTEAIIGKASQAGVGVASKSCPDGTRCASAVYSLWSPLAFTSCLKIPVECKYPPREYP
jgi:hypothetical protein